AVENSAIVTEAAGRTCWRQSDLQCPALGCRLSIDLDDAWHVHARADRDANVLDILIANFHGRATPRLYAAICTGRTVGSKHSCEEIIAPGSNRGDREGS